MGGFHVAQGAWAHAPQSLEPARLRACAPQQEKPPQAEASASPLESSPRSLQLEKAHTQWRPSAVKNIYIYLEKKKIYIYTS